MKPTTIEKVEADLAKHRKGRERGTEGPYTEFELRCTRLHTNYGERYDRDGKCENTGAAYERHRREFNTALRAARRSIARGG